MVLTATASMMAEGPLAGGAGSLDVFAASQLVEAIASDPTLLRGARTSGWRLFVQSGTAVREPDGFNPGDDPAAPSEQQDRRAASDPLLTEREFEALGDLFSGQYDD